MAIAMKIPFFGNDREYLEHETLFSETSKEVWSSGQYLNSPLVDRFEKKMANYCQRDFAIALNSCTDALIFALKCLNLPPRSKVIVPNFSFVASATAILHNELTPVFCDIDPNSFMLTRSELEKVYDSSCKAIIMVSLYGALPNIADIDSFANERNLHIIEDAAQSLGANLDSVKAGSIGSFSTISFDPTKTLHGTGTGGLLLTNNEKFYEMAKQLRLHGKSKNEGFNVLGRKSLMPSHDALLLEKKLDLLEGWVNRRNLIAQHYDNALKDSNALRPAFRHQFGQHAFHKYVLSCNTKETRDLLQNFLTKKGITTRVHYSKPINKEPIFENLEANTPNVEIICERILSLPIFHELRDEEVDYICKALIEFQTL